jgi:hypothetical protein
LRKQDALQGHLAFERSSEERQCGVVESSRLVNSINPNNISMMNAGMNINAPTTFAKTFISFPFVGAAHYRGCNSHERQKMRRNIAIDLCFARHYTVLSLTLY